MNNNLHNFIQFHVSDLASFINYISMYGAELNISAQSYNINPNEYSYCIIHKDKEIPVERDDIVYINHNNEFVIVKPDSFFGELI